MKGAKAELLKQALREMVEHYPRHQLGHRLIRFHRIMRRATVMSEEEKREVEEELHMQYAFDEFIDDNPYVLERIDKKVDERLAKAKAEIEARAAKAEAEAKARAAKAEASAAKAQQDMVLRVLNLRFPSLEGQAQSIIRGIQDIEHLATLFDQIMLAHDEQEALNFLKKSQSPQ